MRCGADAVYIGAQQFSARAKAENFDHDALFRAARICHLAGVKLYLAVNTLLFDDEFEDLDALIVDMVQAGVDACIVQDLGVAAYIRARIPTMPLHASTQMTLHTASGVVFAAQAGFRRIVAARELSRDALAMLCVAGRAQGIEVEAFVHGAQCMSVSGQCWMSAAMGGRSANRGCCAQPCRLPFTADIRAAEAHALSLRDMCLVEHLAELREIGISSFKIEGRMKRPEYVAAAVTAYRKALAGEKPDLVQLRAIFSRSGFTDGYFTSHRNAMFGMREKADVLASQDVLSNLHDLYKKPRKIAVLDANYTILAEKPSQLTVRDDAGNVATATGCIPQLARQHPTDLAQLQRQFQKLGDTIYSAGRVTAELDGISMLPTAALNALRRDATAAMDAVRIDAATPHYVLRAAPESSETSNILKNHTGLRLQIRTLRQLSQIRDFAHHLDALLLPLHLVPQYLANSPFIPPERCILVPPRLILDESRVVRDLEAAKALGFTRIVCNHAGVIPLGKALGMQMHGGLGLHLTNCMAANVFAELSFVDALISPEVPLHLARRISQDSLPLGMLAYGRIPLMLTRNCPIQAQLGCKECAHQLRDRKGQLLFTDCMRYADSPDYVELFNPSPIWMADKMQTIHFAAFFQLQMTEESPERVRAILMAYLGNMDATPPQNFTRGLTLQRTK